MDDINLALEKSSDNSAEDTDNKLTQGADLCTTSAEERPLPWLVLRDLKRSNAKNPAYKMLAEKGFEVYTPMKCSLVRKSRHLERVERPVLPDMVFVHCAEDDISELIEQTPTLLFCYGRGGYKKVIKVEHKDMSRFIEAVRLGRQVEYYKIEEITPSMIGKKVLLKDGVFEGVEVRLLKKSDKKRKYIVVELPSVFAAVVEVNPEYIQLIK